MMRYVVVLACLSTSLAAPAVAQTAPPTAAQSAAAPVHYSSATTPIGTLLDDPASKAILDKFVPGLATNPQIEMVRGMTLKDIQQYSPDKLNDKVLAELDAGFQSVPSKK